MTLYDACLTYGCFPNAWKKACVTEVSGEAANGPRELQANQSAVRDGQVVGANDVCAFG